MEARRIGSLDNISPVGLGCNNFGLRLDPAGTKAVVDAAIDAGVTYFDTAESYGEGLSEEFLGAALSGHRRDEVIVATKWGHTVTLKNGDRGGDPAVVRRSLEASLTRLGTDHVDHYQLHRPDRETPMDETLGALAELVREGKIREIGCTAFNATEIEESGAAAARRGVPRYPSVQNHYSLLTRTPETDGVLAACVRDGLVFVPFFPLESGVLTGKYRAGEALPEGSRLARWGDRAAAFIDEDKLAVVARLDEWANARGHTLLELAMSWLAGNAVVATVIAGATSPAQVASNVAAAGWALTVADRAEVDELCRT